MKVNYILFNLSFEFHVRNESLAAPFNSLPFQKTRQYCPCEFPQRSRVVVMLVLCADSQVTTCVVCAEKQYGTQHGCSPQSAQERDKQF